MTAAPVYAMQGAGANLDEGVMFNDPPRAATWVGVIFLFNVILIGLQIGLRTISADTIWSLSVFVQTLGTVLMALCWAVLRTCRGQKVFADGEGLRVEGEFISYDQIRFIQAQTGWPSFARLTYGLHGESGRLVLFLPARFKPGQFRCLLAEVARRANAKLVYERKLKFLKTKLI
jgi:hypothetical protein